MQYLTALSLALTILLQVAICVLLVWRKLHKQYPWFLAYIIYAFAECIARLVAARNPQTYFSVYWFTEVGDILFTILALRESLLVILWPKTRSKWPQWIFWSCIFAALFYIVWEIKFLPSRQASRFLAIMLDIEFGIDVIISTLGLLCAGSIFLFGLLTRTRATAIILGFTANASIAIFSWITRSVFGTRFRVLSEWIPAIAYIIAEIIWTRELVRPEQRQTEPTQTIEQMGDVMNRYVMILRRYLEIER